MDRLLFDTRFDLHFTEALDKTCEHFERMSLEQLRAKLEAHKAQGKQVIPLDFARAFILDHMEPKQ